MSNHMARIWKHRGSKPLSPKFLLLDHHLDGYNTFSIYITGEWWLGTGEGNKFVMANN